ncbi:hypothetical protein PZN02_004527 [Sinorhizobium garamanticum]|uniref:Uncharacterized protein n=1 Tax=Sinorhizobium garamanticum TaxID=680247 RepID=A0ABY8DJ75_9HYPH|nr:hypothetical protein [Sinorhizobium garamanticum]WEX90944.1 hypothetical protein PZN02_004527 [Sinorhizobium garamanticum]
MTAFLILVAITKAGECMDISQFECSPHWVTALHGCTAQLSVGPAALQE